MTTAIPAMFKASDGREFELEAEADRWEGILGAQEDYARARERFMRLIQRNIATADGVLFKSMERYWMIREPHGSMAWLEEISAYDHCLGLHEWNGQATERAQIRIPVKNRHRCPTDEFIVVDIADLYRSPTEAEAALLEVNREVLARWQEESHGETKPAEQPRPSPHSRSGHR